MSNLDSQHSGSHYTQTIRTILVGSLVGSLLWFVMLFIGGIILFKFKSPINLIVGLPLVLIGGAKVLNSLWDITASIISPKFNQGRCLLCHPKSFNSED